MATSTINIFFKLKLIKNKKNKSAIPIIVTRNLKNWLLSFAIIPALFTLSIFCNKSFFSFINDSNSSSFSKIFLFHHQKHHLF